MDKSEGERPRELPMRARIELVHAYLQIVADQCGADILHVKGAAVHPNLLDGPRASFDVDVLVRPEHLEVFLGMLFDRGWTRLTGFEEGSAFGHAMNLRHSLGLIDVHRRWPGFEISAAAAFDQLWNDRGVKTIAHVPCQVPSERAQRLILLLHYARSGGQRAGDFDRSWTQASPPVRAEVIELAEQFGARLALAAAIGDLDTFRSDPGYRLWRYFADGQGTRFEEWLGRWNAARGLSAKAKVARGFVSVNEDLLRAELGREPQARDYVAASGRRLRHALDDARRLSRRSRSANSEESR